MSILFKGNLEEGNYTLIKSTDGWVLKGETSYVGFNLAEPKTGEWHKTENDEMEITGYYCSVCDMPTDEPTHICPNCGAVMRGKEE